MTFWAKLFTIVVFVLSIAFAAMSGVLFAKREDYRAQLEVAKVQHADEAKQLQAKILKAEGERDAKATELQNAKTELNARQVRIDNLSGEVAQSRGQIQELKTDLQAVRNNAAKFAQASDTLAKENSALLRENEAAVRENRKLYTDLRAERTRTSELAKANAALKSERDDLKVKTAEAEKKLRRNDETFAALAEANIEANKIINANMLLPDVKAKIASVDLENGLVILNAGSNQGVKKNFEFTVFRDDNFVATVNVFHLQDDYSAARIVTKKLDIQLGDNAWTRLP